MKVFISWSEARSKAVAEALYSWLPTIIQPVRPWMSEHDIDKGTRGLPAISRQLEETQFGIICLTPENLGAPWLLFEAGALSKSQDQARVWTFLYGLEHTDIRGPLAQFQHTKMGMDDVQRLLRAINTAQGEPLITERQLDTAFNRGWAEFERQLKAIPASQEVVPERTERDMIKEILEIVRAHARDRQQTSYEADRYFASFMPLVTDAFGNNPNTQASELARTASELQHLAKVRLLARELAGKRADDIYDPAAGSSTLLRDVATSTHTTAQAASDEDLPESPIGRERKDD